MAKVTKLSTIILDVDFLNDPKIDLLIERFGDRAISYYIRLITALAREGGHLSYTLASGLGRAIATTREQFVEFLNFAIEKELVFLQDSIVLSQRILKDIQEVERKRENWRNGKKTLRDSQKNLGVSELAPEPEKEPELNLKNGAFGDPAATHTGELSPKPKPPAGKTERAPGVFLDDSEIELAKSFYQKVDLEPQDVEIYGLNEVSRHYKSYPAKISQNRAYSDLVSTFIVQKISDVKTSLQRNKTASDPPKNKFETAEERNERQYQKTKQILAERDREEEVQELKNKGIVKNETAGIAGLLKATTSKLPKLEHH